MVHKTRVKAGDQKVVVFYDLRDKLKDDSSGDDCMVEKGSIKERVRRPRCDP